LTALPSAASWRRSTTPCQIRDFTRHRRYNLYGYQEDFTDGGHLIADEDYLRGMIVNPNNRIVAGYQPIMPSYRGLLNDQAHDVDDLILYIKTLSDKYQPTTAPTLP
jgi:hypothetical protein